VPKKELLTEESSIMFCFFLTWFRPTVLCKIVGVYQIGVHNKVTGKRSMEQVAVMQNIFYKRRITKIFDLKGSLRGRFAAQKDEVSAESPTRNKKRSGKKVDDRGRTMIDTFDDEIDPVTTRKQNAGPTTMLDGDFLEFTSGRPMPLTDRARAVFQMSILNVSLLFSIKLGGHEFTFSLTLLIIFISRILYFSQ
jgi:1-phosphatidylinositol-3-phosphate 5-kinase